MSHRGDDRGPLPPLLVGRGGVRAVRIVGDFDEAWLQQTIFENPHVLPIAQIEPVFGGAVPVAREMQTGRGPVDIALVNGEGYPVLVETKLWRNPEARREVVAQAISYAAAMSGWDAERFAEAVARARGESGGAVASLTRAVQRAESFDERGFWDRLTANLRRGRVLLLIAGDGIREGVHELTDALQAAPHLSFALALVELPVYDLGDGQRLMVPRVPLRTTEIARRVIEVRSRPGPAEIVEIDGGGGGRRPPVARRLSHAAFLERLRAAAGDRAADFVQWVADRVEGSDRFYTSMSKRGLAIHWRDETEAVGAKLIRFFYTGQLGAVEGLQQSCRENGLPEAIARDWMTGLIGLLGAGTPTPIGQRGFERLRDADGKPLGLLPLVDRRDGFWTLLERTGAALERAVATRGRPS